MFFPPLERVHNLLFPVDLTVKIKFEAPFNRQII